MRLDDPGTLKSFLSRHGLAASKGLGQHFLCSRPVVDKIVACFEGFAGLLEIGPGPGVLTGPLSESAQKLIALEVDDRMISALLDSAPQAEIRKLDALKADLASILGELPEPRGVVSNLPYYITGPLITRIAEASCNWTKSVLMMQKEVAVRVMAKPGSSDRGSLSVYLQSQFEIRIIAQVPAGSFVPPPKVDSTVLELVPLERQHFPGNYFRLVRLAFAQPRKTLVNNLVSGLRLPRERAISAVTGVGLKETARAQELTLEQWFALAKALE